MPAPAHDAEKLTDLMNMDACKTASPQSYRKGEGVTPGSQAGAAISPAEPEPFSGQGKAVLELRVAGHSGSLPQVCGLLARRAFQVEAMLCLPASGGRQSIWLLVPEDGRLGQLMHQVGKLGDVLDVDRRDGLGPFGALMAP